MRNFPNLSANSMDLIVAKLKKKARQSPSKFHISAIAFDKRGAFLGQAFNHFRPGLSQGKGQGLHAERALMNRYGDLIKTIMICRIGSSGDWLPIRPCNQCLETATKLGIKIVTIHSCREQ